MQHVDDNDGNPPDYISSYAPPISITIGSMDASARCHGVGNDGDGNLDISRPLIGALPPVDGGSPVVNSRLISSVDVQRPKSAEGTDERPSSADYDHNHSAIDADPRIPRHSQSSEATCVSVASPIVATSGFQHQQSSGTSNCWDVELASAADEIITVRRPTEIQSTWFSSHVDWAKQLRTASTFRRRVLIFIACWSSGLSAFVWIMGLVVAPCPITSLSAAGMCSHWSAAIVYNTQIANFAITYLMLISPLLSEDLPYSASGEELADHCVPLASTGK